MALKSDGTVWTWGLNSNGQLGIGSTVSSNAPVKVTSLTGISMIGAGYYHSLALKNDGTVWSWGLNGNGQVGDGTTTQRNSPVQLTSLTGVTAISAGYYHSIALKSNGTVWTWGNNSNGQLGIGNTTGTKAPVQVTALTNVVAVAAGSYHSLALKADGTVWSWGLNANGQLGNNSTTQATTPVQVSGLSGIALITAGAYHNFAISSTGVVYAWGLNTNGQIGDGTGTTRLVPVALTSLTNVTAISAGGFHSLALKNDGSVWAWGLNTNGQLGNSSLVQSAVPVQMQNVSTASAVAAGYAQSFAVRNDGFLWAVGCNSSGQLGDGTVSQRMSPDPAQNITGITALSADGNHNLLLKKDGSVWAFGSNASGQLGDGSTTQRPYAIQTLDLTAVTQVVAGSNHSLAIKNDGTLWTWGSNSNGQIGDGSRSERNAPVAVTGLSGIVEAGGGAYHSIALKSDGSVWTWGANTSGQLGDGTTTQRLSPVQVSIANVAAIAAGQNHNLVLKSDGTVWAWGLNTNGELGNNTTTASKTPVEVSTLSGIVAISAGATHSMALKSDGTVWTWGYNANGQIGDGTITQRNVPVQISSLSGIEAISAGDTYNLALKNNGTVYAWGNNTNGQLGDGTVTQRNAPVLIAGLSGIVGISGGIAHSLALKEDGTIESWGNNTTYQLGLGANYAVALLLPGFNLNAAVAQPTIVISGPTNNSSDSLYAPLTITSSASEPNGQVSSVQYNFDAAPVGQSATSPYSVNWTPHTWGVYPLTALATDANGTNSPVSATVNINVPYQIDSNGLPDWWELQYFGQLGENANASVDGNGLTLQQDYQQGNDPTNYYSQNGGIISPTLAVSLDAGQINGSGTLGVQPIIVSVTNAGAALPNAPITLVAGSGNGTFSLTNGGAASGTLSLVADASGHAEVYYQQPSGDGANSKISVSAGRAQAGFAETSLLETTIVADGSGTVILSWSPPSYGTVGSYLIEERSSNGNWTILQDLANSGTNSFTVSGLTANQAYTFQVLACGQQSAVSPVAVTCEVWQNLSGTMLTNLQQSPDYPLSPTTKTNLASFETGPDSQTNTGERLRGYVTAPQTGYYTFYISGGGMCQLWVSTDSTPANAVPVASIPQNDSTGFRQITYPQQVSSPVYLTAGQVYYLEAQLKQSTSAVDSLSVGWRLPDNSQEFPIQASHLTPYTNYGGYMSESWLSTANPSLTWASFSNPSFNSGTVFSQSRAIVSGTVNPTAPSAGFIKASGWLYPTETGSYSLSVSSTGNAQVNLSTDATVANKQTVIQSMGGSGTSNAITLTAGSRYYFEVLTQVSGPSDQAVLGWRLPDGSLQSAVPRQELAPDLELEGPTWEFWTDINDQTVSSLVTSIWYPNEPVSRTQQSLLEMQTNVQWSGTRIHGYIQAPETGNYTFYISGDDESQLSISPTTDPTLETVIASVPDGGFTPFRQWNVIPSQTSAPVSLQAGQWYYLEALEKNGHDGGYVSVAWTLPDGTFEGPVPGWRFDAPSGRLGNLPVVRITSPVNGATFNDTQSLSIAATVTSLDRPITNVQLFEDGTKIADLTGPSYQYTFPTITAGDHTLSVVAADDLSETAHDQISVHVFAAADSNGNGIPDNEELTQTFTDPDGTAITGIDTAATINSESYSNISSPGDWVQTANGLISNSVQGWVEYTVNLSSPDIYRVLVQATPYLNSTPTTLLTLGIEIDGVKTDQVDLPNSSSPNPYAVTYTPYLPAGTHTIRLLWTNYSAQNAVIIKGVVFEELEGAIDPATGMKQWVENRLAHTDSTTVAPPNSPVSPVCIEGTTRFAGEVSISNGIAVQHGTANNWYANVPLSATAPTSTTIAYENGARTEQKTFTWQPTDILTVNQITVRKGDSLLLTATGGSTNTVPVTLQLPGQAPTNTDSATPLPYQFNQTGTFTIPASYFGSLPNLGAYNSQTGYQGTLTVSVVDASFDDYALAWTTRPRTWNCPDVPANVFVEADPAIQFAKTTSQPASGSQFTALTQEAQDYYAVARLYAGGPIIDNAPIRGFWVMSSDEANLTTVQTYPDGSLEIEMDVVVSLLTPDMSIVLETHLPDVLFDDGTIEKTLTAKDFDAHNTAKVYFIVPNSHTSICHGLTVYQGGAYVGTR